MGNANRVEALRALAARMAAMSGKRVTVTAESAAAVSQALFAYADQLERPVSEHPLFTVDVWDDCRVIETLAGCSNLLVGRAAFEQATKERSRYRVTLRQGIRMVAEHKGDIVKTGDL